MSAGTLPRYRKQPYDAFEIQEGTIKFNGFDVDYSANKRAFIWKANGWEYLKSMVKVYTIDSIDEMAKAFSDYNIQFFQGNHERAQFIRNTKCTLKLLMEWVSIQRKYIMIFVNITILHKLTL